MHRHGFCVSRSRSQVLSAIRHHAVNVAVWKRQLPAEMEAALRGVPCFSAEAELDPEEPPPPALVATVPVPARGFLHRDISVLRETLLEAMGACRMKLTLHAIRDDRCRKFHVDYYPLRVVTTYAGPGTEWLPDPAVDWSAMARSPACPEEANRAIAADARRIRRARPGDVLFLKGVGLAGSERRAAVHRSPPIERDGGSRLVLVLTALEPAVPQRLPAPRSRGKCSNSEPIGVLCGHRGPEGSFFEQNMR